MPHVTNYICTASVGSEALPCADRRRLLVLFFLCACLLGTQVGLATGSPFALSVVPLLHHPSLNLNELPDTS